MAHGGIVRVSVDISEAFFRISRDILAHCTLPLGFPRGILEYPGKSQAILGIAWSVPSDIPSDGVYPLSAITLLMRRG